MDEVILYSVRIIFYFINCFTRETLNEGTGEEFCISKICWILDRAVLINVKFSNYAELTPRDVSGPPSFPRLNDSEWKGSARKSEGGRWNGISCSNLWSQSLEIIISRAKWTLNLFDCYLGTFWACYSRKTKINLGIPRFIIYI